MLDQWFPNSTVSGLGICIWRKQRVRCFDWDSLCPLRFVLCHLGPLRCGTNAGNVSNWWQHSLVKKDLLCYGFRLALWKLSFSSFLRGDILISPLCLSEVWQVTFIDRNFFWNNVVTFSNQFFNWWWSCRSFCIDYKLNLLTHMLQGVICKLYRLYIPRHFIRFRGQSFWRWVLSLSLSSVISWRKNSFYFTHVCLHHSVSKQDLVQIVQLYAKRLRARSWGSWGLNPSRLTVLFPLSHVKGKVAWESHSKGRLDSEDRRKNSSATETFAVLAQAVFPRESKQATQAKTNGFDEMDMPSHQVPGGKLPSICFRDFVVWWHGVWIAQFNIFTL